MKQEQLLGGRTPLEEGTQTRVGTHPLGRDLKLPPRIRFHFAVCSGKNTYFWLNIPTPCPPRSAVPV